MLIAQTIIILWTPIMPITKKSKSCLTMRLKDLLITSIALTNTEIILYFSIYLFITIVFILNYILKTFNSCRDGKNKCPSFESIYSAYISFRFHGNKSMFSSEKNLNPCFLLLERLTPLPAFCVCNAIKAMSVLYF